MKSRGLWLVGLVIAAFALGHFSAEKTAKVPTLPNAEGFLWPNPPTINSFALIDDRGAAFTEDALAGHWTMLFFGYTHCPDICPSTLATLKLVRMGLRDNTAVADKGQVVLVSLDAARDTPEVLRGYLAHFGPGFRGASGPPEALHLLTRQLAASFTRVSTEENGDYWFDHSAAVYLIAPDLRVVGEFLPPLEPSRLIREIRQIIAFFSPAS